MRDWDEDEDLHRPRDERPGEHTARLTALVVAAGVVTLLMVLLIGPLFNGE